jgi:hypothetical protein
VETYRTALRDFAAQPILTVWYQHLEIEQALADYKASLTAGKGRSAKRGSKRPRPRLRRHTLATACRRWRS